MRVVAASCLLVVVFASTGRAQAPVMPGGELDAYLRMLELRGQTTGRPLAFYPGSARWPSVVTGTEHPWSHTYSFTARRAGAPVELLDADTRLTYNSAFPSSTNDGVLWAGRGISGIASAGARLRVGPVTATLFPSLTFAQNREFALGALTFPGLPQFAYPWQGQQAYNYIAFIDYPQRFGDSPITAIDWGQSGIRLDLGAFTAGLSMENLWWGPAIRNPILMSTTAGGFPHIDLGTGRALSGKLGTLEGRIIWGGLHQSKYFNTLAVAPALSYEPRSDGSRFLTGAIVGYRPTFLPGLTLGLSRVLYQAWPDGGLGSGDLLGALSPFSSPNLDTLSNGQLGNDLWDQMVSISARWVLPQSGFEAFVEWARNDFGGNVRDLVLELDHGRGFTAGFQKLLTTGTGLVRLAGELTTLGRPHGPGASVHPLLALLRSPGLHRTGNSLGAGIGPGSQSQYLGMDRYTGNGRWGLFLERVRFDDDAAFSLLRKDADELTLHDVSLTAGMSIVRFVSSVDLISQLELTREFNRYLLDHNDVTNVKLTFGLRWRSVRN